MRLPPVLLAALVPIVLSANTAHGENLTSALEIAGPTPPPQERSEKTDKPSPLFLSTLFSGGAMPVGPYSLGGVGARLELGLDLGRFHVVGEQTFMYFSSSTPNEMSSGLFSRTGVTLRLPIGEWRNKGGTSAGYFEFAAGRQRVPAIRVTNRWDGGVGYVTEVRTKNIAVMMGGRFLAAPKRESESFFAISGREKRNELDIGVLVTLGARLGVASGVERAEPISMAEDGDVGDVTGFEYGLGIRDVNGRDAFGGTIALRRVREFGKVGIGGETSVSILSVQTDEDAPIGDDGLAARLAMTASYSYWRPQWKSLRGDFFADGSLGYTIGSVSSGRFHGLDAHAGGGVGYQILEADADSRARSFGAHLFVRSIASSVNLRRLGWTFGIGLGWGR